LDLDDGVPNFKNVCAFADFKLKFSFLLLEALVELLIAPFISIGEDKPI